MKKTNNNQTTNSHSKGYEKYAKKDKSAKPASKSKSSKQVYKSKPVKPALKSKPSKTVPKPKEGSFLYLLPEDISAKQLHDGLDFLEAKQLEVWTELNLLEVTVDEGTITFEDMRDNLREEDFGTLAGIGMKKVYAVDYYLSDNGILLKVMETLISKFGGKIGSDTENFQPFVKVNEI